jgi:hypothetical protein
LGFRDILQAIPEFVFGDVKQEAGEQGGPGEAWADYNPLDQLPFWRLENVRVSFRRCDRNVIYDRWIRR